MKKSLWIGILCIAILCGLSSCEETNAVGTRGTLQLVIQESGKGIDVPGMTISHYFLTICSGEDIVLSKEVASTGDCIELEGGHYRVVLEGHNENKTAVASGSAEVDVEPLRTASVSITLEELSGTGQFHLSLKTESGHSLTLSIQDADGEVVAQRTLEAGNPDYEATVSLANGFYLYELSEDTQTLSRDVFRVYRNTVTECGLEIPLAPVASFSGAAYLDGVALNDFDVYFDFMEKQLILFEKTVPAYMDECGISFCGTGRGALFSYDQENEAWIPAGLLEIQPHGEMTIIPALEGQMATGAVVDPETNAITMPNSRFRYQDARGSYHLDLALDGVAIGRGVVPSGCVMVDVVTQGTVSYHLLYQPGDKYLENHCGPFQMETSVFWYLDPDFSEESRIDGNVVVSNTERHCIYGREEFEVSLTISTAKGEDLVTSDPEGLLFFYKATPQWEEVGTILGTRDDFVLIPDATDVGTYPLGAFQRGQWLIEVLAVEKGAYQEDGTKNVVYQGDVNFYASERNSTPTLVLSLENGSGLSK